jgi:hypothetical protein
MHLPEFEIKSSLLQVSEIKIQLMQLPELQEPDTNRE